MKTTTRTKAAASLKYDKTIIKGKEKTVVHIRLDDDCGNGHCDFSITCDIYERRGNGWREWGGGCDHDHILSVAPQFKPFVALHLADFTGAPMYAVENGFYHLRNKENPREKRLDIAARHFRIGQAEAEKLEAAEDVRHMRYLVEEMGLPELWQTQADAAIEMLEALTGGTFDRTKAGESRFQPLTDQEALDIAADVDAGYYAPEAVEKRKEEARAARVEKKRQAIKEEAEKARKKASTQEAVRLAILNADESLEDCFIYYDHTNTLTANWRGYGRQITQVELDAFAQKLDRSRLPEGLKLELARK